MANGVAEATGIDRFDGFAIFAVLNDLPGGYIDNIAQVEIIGKHVGEAGRIVHASLKIIVSYLRPARSVVPFDGHSPMY